MISQVFSVFDSKAATYAMPWFSATRETAIRAFMGAVRDETMLFSKYPEDFSLMHIGSFDDDTGRLYPLEVPINLGLAASFKVRSENAPQS